jgi:uncharacterized protein (DUF697 family)/ethanolamine utilization protein EutP (predicted NTPase)
MDKSKRDSGLEKEIKEVGEIIIEELQDFIGKRKRPTILVAGYTGTGKTSLIQAICGKHIVPDNRIAAGLPKTQAFDFYEDMNIRFFDSKGLELGESEESFLKETDSFVRKMQDNQNVDNHIHLVWYAIQGSGARVTPCDLRLINKIFKNVIVIISKRDITTNTQFESMREVLTRKGVDPQRILSCAIDDEDSLIKLIEVSYDLLPEAYRDAFISAQILDLNKKESKAHFIIHSAAGSAGLAGGGNPFPVSDALLIAPIQVGMIIGLGALLGESKEAIKKMFGPQLAKTLGKMTASGLQKLLPFLGQIGNALVAAALTEALGWATWKSLKKRFEAKVNGIDMSEFNFDEENLKKAYESARK